MAGNIFLRKCISVILVAALFTATAFLLSGCGNKNKEDDTSPAETQEDASSFDDGASIEAGDMPEIDMTALAGEDGVDVDLTQLSSTMVYSVVYDMTNKPNNYMGKTIRMNGTMSIYEDEDSGNTYYACIIKDAAACCAQGIEFITEDDYPSDGSEVTVVGIYDLYEEDGYEYCVLKDAKIES